jgi:non-reducing end alpha-L-arabinofuranosidase
VPTPAVGRGGFGGPIAAASTPNRSSGRFPDGRDTDSNCTDFLLQPATTSSADAGPGATNIKVASVADFAAGQTITIDTDALRESAVIATVGTAGATTVTAATLAGATVIPVASGAGFTAGQSITIDSGANRETAVIASATGGGRGGGARITVTAPLTLAHPPGAQVSGSGITLTTALTRAHAGGAQVGSNVPTPGAPNQYSRRR